MKVSLVVASGAHQGKVIPITGPSFVIGRDAQCHLRPASQAISKRHCGIAIRDGKVYVQDLGSTNGTTVNDQLMKNTETVIEDGASVKLGPLDFIVKIEKTAVHDGTPLPAASPETSAALAAVKAAAAASKAPPARDTTPNPARVTKPGSKEAPALTGSKEAAALKANQPNPAEPALAPAEPPASDDENDRMAAMLLGMDDDGTSEVPDGSTVMEMPAPGLTGEQKPGQTAEEKEKKKATSREDMTNAASEILRKMMRRPK